MKFLSKTKYFTFLLIITLVFGGFLLGGKASHADTPPPPIPHLHGCADANLAATIQADSHTTLNNALATYSGANYNATNWATLVGFKATGDTLIDAAASCGDVVAATNNALSGMAGVPTIAATATLNSISIATLASKLNYLVGESLDITGMIVVGYYSDTTSKIETIATSSVTGFDSSVPVTGQTLTVTVGTSTATYHINVSAPVTLSTIAITHPANKLSYTVGDTLDITGLVVMGTYSDNSTSTLAIASSSITGFNSVAPATNQVLTITVNGKHTNYSVNINAVPATLSSIAITHPANKLSYTVGDTLDITGLVVTGTYSDNSTSTLAVVASDVAGFNNSAPATGQVLTITVGTKTTTYSVNIVAATTGGNSGSSGGGGGGSLMYCSAVVYSDWGVCVSGKQYRNIFSQTPSFCTPTVFQQLNQSRNCEEAVLEPVVPPIIPQVLGVTKYANGTLLKASGKDVYVVLDNKLKLIADLKELHQYRGPVLRVSDSVISSFAKYSVLGVKKYADGTLLKAKNSPKVYVIKKGKKVYIKSMAELRKYKGKVIVVTAEELAKY